MKSRLYKVTELSTGTVRIVEAYNAAHASKHVAGSLYDVKSVSGLEAVRLISEGVRLEVAVSEKDTAI